MPDSTSKINPRKFFGMGPGPLEKRVAGNEKKITLLKNILKAQQITIGEQLQSLSSAGAMSLDESIQSITDSVTSISQTLLAQQDLDKGKQEDDRIAGEKNKRNLRENLLETGKGIGKGAKDTAMKAIAPVKGFLEQIGNWFMKLFAAKAVIELIGWFSDPANEKKVSQIFRFIKDWWPALLTGILLFAGSMLGPAGLIIGVGALVVAFLPKLINTVKTLFGFGKSTEKDAKKLEEQTKKQDEVGEDTGQKQEPTSGDIKNIKEPGGYNLGGLVPGQGNEDSVPAMLTPGEFVMSKGAVGHWGKGTLEGMNAAGGGKNSGNPLVGYKEGGEVPEMNRPTQRLYNQVAPLTKADDGKPKGLKGALAGAADFMTGGLFDFDGKSGGGLLSKGKNFLGGLFGGKKKEESGGGGGTPGGEGKDAITGFVKTLERIPLVGKTISKAGSALVTGVEGMIKHQHEVLHKSSATLSGDQDRRGSVGPPSRPSTTVAYSDAMDAAQGGGGAGNTATPGGDIPNFSAGSKVSSQKIKVLGITI